MRKTVKHLAFTEKKNRHKPHEAGAIPIKFTGRRIPERCCVNIARIDVPRKWLLRVSLYFDLNG